ncbi:MAG: DNA polymerase [Candidatus Altiarchaeales archaeon]|nr:DNA polymerase [Candidatus Altiarchaeales archaeon]
MKTLLDADYIVRDERPVVRLFYKQDDERVIEEVADFEPYFYALSSVDINVLAEKVKALENVTKVETKTMTDIKGEVEVLRINTKIPGNVAELRVKVASLQECREVREADIPFSRRYLIDSQLSPMENAENIGLTIASLDIECLSEGGAMDADKNPIIMVSYADNKGLNRVWTCKKTAFKAEWLEVLEGEKTMIEKLVQTIGERNIDLIVSYNGDNFDFPYIEDRAKKFGVKVDVGIDGEEVKTERRGMNMGARVKGRPHVDLYPVCRQTFNLPRYQLEDVYLHIFKEEKRDIDTGKMREYWDDEKKFPELAEYSLSDAVSTLKIAERVLPLQYELCRVIREPIYENSRMSSSQRVERLLMNKAFEKNVVVPNRPSDDESGERYQEPFEGAYVLEPLKGIHDNIVLFDFRSLYPSIIISHNVDPSTIDCKCCKKEEAHIAPNNHYFCKKKKGFIPGVLEWLVKKRGEMKDEFKKEADSQKKAILNVKQQALKLLGNSMYGYYAFVRARWYSRDCAEAIAAWGREYIQKTIDEARKTGFEVVYGDTDSIFITKPGEQDKKKIESDAKEFVRKVNEKLPEAMELEFEGFYPRGIFITKKRYALTDEKGLLTVKGLETKRRDWAEIAKDTQNKVLHAILHDRNPEKAAEIVKQVVKDIKEGRVKLKDLAIYTQMTRGMGEYLVDGPHIQAAKKAMKQGMNFKQGSIITYVITKKGDSISDQAKVIDFVEEGDYDADYYIGHQVIPAVLRILEALGYSEQELRGLGKQMSLEDW